MKYSIPVKFTAFLLVVCTVVMVVACGALAVILQHNQLYDVPPEEREDQWYFHAGYPVAWMTTQQYAALTVGECPWALVEQLYGTYPTWDNTNYYVCITLEDEVVYTSQTVIDDGFTSTYTMTPEYPKVVRIINAADDSILPTRIPGEQEDQPSLEDILLGTDPVRTEQVNILADGQSLIYELYYYQGPTYTVSVTMSEDALKDTFHSNLSILYHYRYALIWGAVLSFVLMLALVVYLICAAGRATDGKIQPGGLNRLALDVYLLCAALIGWIPLRLLIRLINGINSLSYATATLLLVCGAAVCLLVIAWLYALAAQIKVGKNYWWRHSLLGYLTRKLLQGVRAIMRLMPVIWQWLLVTVLMGTAATVTFLLAWDNVWWTMAFFLCCIGGFITVIYGGYCFGTILSGAKRMSQGQLEHQVPTKHMIGSFRDCAEQLNSLSGTAKDAVQKQVRSERIKTELITNVSHDIKTPLTSIINFVDLLQKPHSEEEEQQYLSVLARQSQQMKKLIEDLLELSRASTGNLIVHITEFDAVESVNQALGEFSDKLEKAGLTPVFYPPREPMMIRADGRLVWRVLSNLLSNAVKYAAPGTRLYVELQRQDDKVQLSVKNISREELRVSAEMLMERFVQGDASRNTEGSGLGLNIAKSLMEVQHGTLTLLLDGDLFKVTLEFPGV